MKPYVEVRNAIKGDVDRLIDVYGSIWPEVGQERFESEILDLFKDVTEDTHMQPDPDIVLITALLKDRVVGFLQAKWRRKPERVDIAKDEAMKSQEVEKGLCK